MSRPYIFLAMSLLIYSCQSYNLRRDIASFQAIQFKLPRNSSHIPTYRLVVFFDSASCTTCGYNNLYLWDEMIEFSSENPMVLQNYFIFSPSLHSVDELRDLIDNGKYNVWLDTNNLFLESNPAYAENTRFTTFLINNEGKAVLMGNPIFNEPLYQLYRNTIGFESGTGFSILDSLDLKSDPSLVFDRRMYNLGTVHQNETVNIRLTAFNKTDEDIMITDMASDCPCIVSEDYKYKFIPAHESIPLNIEFSATYTGDFVHKISFKSSYSGLNSDIALYGTVR